MPHFVLLGKWTDQGIRNVKDAPKRADWYSQVVDQNGGRVLSRFITMGRYDVVSTFEAPDAATATAIAAQLSASGNIRTETLPAFTIEEFHGILSKL